MTTVGLLGDCHSNFSWIHYAIDAFDRRGVKTVIQVGDLGIWPGKQYAREWDKVQAHLEQVGQLWVVVPGNHEDYDQIDAIPVDEETGWKAFRDLIALVPRGGRWEMGSMSFVALGGANSVDRGWRLKNSKTKTWWPQESITEEDVANVIAGGYADVMVGHDAPLGVPTIDRNIAGNPFGFDPVDLQYANEGRAMMDKAFRAVAPQLFIHGHYHFRVNDTIEVGSGRNCRVMGLSKDEENYSLGELNTETGVSSATLLDIRKDHSLHRYSEAVRGWKNYVS